MTEQELITLTTRHIDNAFRELQRILLTYEKNENTIETNLDRLQRVMHNTMINILDRSGFELIFTLADSNNRIKRINDFNLREIDNLTSIIAGYLTVLIDECIENYSSRTKVQTRIRLQRLADMRELTISEEKKYLSFPIAVAILSPYLMKTRISSNSANLVSIRQAIASLSEPGF